MLPPHFFLALFLCPAIILADPLHVPLRHRSPAKRDWNREMNNLRVKYGYQPSSGQFPRFHRSNRRGSVAGISLLDQGADVSYVATMTMGTPPQQFDVVLDTGSSDLWLPGTDCFSCPSASPVFETSKSSTFQEISANEVVITYGSGKVQGIVGTETVSMGGFQVANQTFVLVDTMRDDLIDAPVSGLMGLAFQTLSSTGSVPFWQALTDNGQLSSPEMSFALGRDTNAKDDNVLVREGIFTLGGTNSTLFSGDIQYTDIVQPAEFWALTLSELTVDNATLALSTNNPLSAIDTGTTLIAGPDTDVVAFYNAIPGSAINPNATGMYLFPCDTTVSVSMAFGGGQLWSINPEDFNVGPIDASEKECQGALFSLGNSSEPGQPTWIIGDTFLKNVYTVFRSSPASVGFAQLSVAAGGNGTAAAGSSGSSGSSQSSSAPMSTTVPAFFMLTTAFTAAIVLCL